MNTSNPIRSVRSRIVLLVGGITALALGLGFILLKAAEAGHRRNLSEQLAIGSRAVAAAVDLQLARYASILEVLAQTQSLGEGDLASFEQVVRRVAEREDVGISLMDDKGKQLLNSSLESGKVPPDFFVPPELRTSLEKGEAYISDVTASPITGGPMLYFSKGVVGNYILTIAISPFAFGERLAMPRLAPEGTVAVVDRQGNIAARNRAAQEYVGTPATGDVAALIARQREGIIESVTKDGIPVLTSCSRAHSGWTALVAVPKAHVLGVVEQLLSRALLLSLALIGLALALAHWLGRDVVNAVRALTDNSARLALRQPLTTETTGLAETDLVLDAMRQTSRRLIEQEQERNKAEEALRKAHEELAAANSELEKRVDERTSRLRQTIEELEAFSYSIAHDMRAPLRSMRSFSQILTTEYRERLDGEGSDYLQRISSSAERLDRLLMDVLKLSRLTREELPISEVDAHELLLSIIASYPNLEQHRRSIHIQDRLPNVLANEAALTQCLSNLLTNAIKFTVPGAPPRVNIWAEEAGNGEVRICVQDHGVGIPNDKRERIFNIFEKLDKHTDGTGIGLAIVKRSVERMGGAVTVKSQFGEGSTFSIRLRAASVSVRSGRHEQAAGPHTSVGAALP